MQEASQPPTKWEVYEQILGIPYYVVFDRYTEQEAQRAERERQRVLELEALLARYREQFGDLT